MGFSTSIHVATPDIDSVLASLRKIREHDCVVGRSGEGWIGIYSWRCEDSGAMETPQLTLRLSGALEEPVLGFCLGEEDFDYWLCRHGKMLDQRHPNRILGFFSKKRPHELLTLAKNTQLRQQMEAALVPKKRELPSDVLGMTEKDFIAQTYEDLARFRKMSPAEQEQMKEKYARLQSPHYDDFEIVCKALGITESNLNYSDLAKAREPGEVAESWPGMDLRLLE